MTSILFLTAAPDGRDSTANLGRLVDEANSRSDCSAELWYLRCSPEHTPRPRSRTVDRLRTWFPARLLDFVGLRTLAAGLRGARLRRWLRRLDPEVVVLDDGLGRRVVDGLRPAPTLVVRLNRQPPEHLHLEPSPEEHADLWLVPAGTHPPDDASPVSHEFPFEDRLAGQFLDPSTRRRLRLDLGLPADADLMIGWGDDGWLDGPDLFVRTLWSLEHRHGTRLHGVWFGLTSDRDEAARIHTEASRCGVAERFHMHDSTAPADRLCGDAVLLPYRSTADADEVIDASLCGAVTVVFDACEVAHPLVSSVRDLDVDAAAAAIVAGLGVARPERTLAAARQFHPGPTLDDILSIGRKC